MEGEDELVFLQIGLGGEGSWCAPSSLNFTSLLSAH